MFTELVFLCLVLWKIRQSSKLREDYKLADEMQPHNHDLIGLMANDSKKYFFWMFFICFIGTCLNVLNIVENTALQSFSFAVLLPVTINNAYATFAIAAVTILAPKLILNLRIEHYGPVGSLVEKSQLSWKVAGPEDNMDASSPRRGGSQRSHYSVIVDQEPNEML
ncbi:uncharacterized protein FOMMEDRAFT_154439 [Fomitiporia mediterranea MF3/22]|uniref:uncharacterized protein n=1 Tax=Fomitiporia mediterranea (strain MF3/22) TaxID=694068 RepID=UPI0004408EC2|nr:uncharacterized protein FOMMEDRAFT_154439 [Fomitiporia mediterranea MF3/22]EJD05225.1 hypothetical protein FOMMEDRAFT_154439 [Fomitiporia mediterranea MF3/22]